MISGSFSIIKFENHVKMNLAITFIIRATEVMIGLPHLSTVYLATPPR